MTNPIATAEPIDVFFERYTKYLSEGNLEELAAIYNYPALAISAMGCLVISDSQQTQAFFSQALDTYRAQQLFSARVHTITTDVEAPGIWIGHVMFDNLDQHGSLVSQECNAYQIVTLSDGTRRIAVTTPLDTHT